MSLCDSNSFTFFFFNQLCLSIQKLSSIKVLRRCIGRLRFRWVDPNLSRDLFCTFSDCAFLLLHINLHCTQKSRNIFPLVPISSCRLYFVPSCPHRLNLFCKPSRVNCKSFPFSKYATSKTYCNGIVGHFWFLVNQGVEILDSFSFGF